MPDLLAGLPELRVGPLGHRDARALLDSALPVRLDESIVERIVRETQGNPLALLEMPRGLTPAQLAGGFGLPDADSLSDQIEESFLRRLASLSRPARELLLLAAAEPAGDPTVVWGAARLLGIPESTVRQVESEGLVSFSAEVIFRHPLVRSAIYGAAQPDERSRAHAALAAATDETIDPDRRAWHRAQAASMPDEDVAVDLERSAARAQARGGFGAAAAFLERATALTPDAARRSGRALAAAQAKLQSGALDEALRLVATAESGTLNDLEQAKATLLRGQVSFLATHGSDATSLLVAAAERFSAIDPDLACETYFEALTAAIFAGQLAPPDSSSRAIAQAARAAPHAHKTSGPDLLLDGFAAALADSYGSAVPLLRAAQRAIADMSTTEQVRWMWGATVASLLLWDDEGWERLSSLHANLVRDTGALSDLAISLSHQGQLHVFSGELALAASAQEALLEASDLTQSPLAPYHSAALVAMRGRENEAARFIDASRAEVTARGEGAGIAFMDWAESLLYNGLGRYEEALRAARRVFAHSQLVELNWALPELIEAAARVGDLDSAIEADRLLSERTGASGTDWALGVAARSHALVTNNADAERLYREAMECLERTRMAVDLARSHLLYGEWLRREQRRRDAREHLRIAHERFLEFGMEAFAQRAASELRATGAKSRARTEETRLNLTPQELRISELAAHGATNKEIAAQMFISAATVEYHLHKVFRKLDVKTRTQLAQQLVQLWSQGSGS
jgi:DNA-binding CsgD family transcriptional regulator